MLDIISTTLFFFFFFFILRKGLINAGIFPITLRRKEVILFISNTTQLSEIQILVIFTGGNSKTVGLFAERREMKLLVISPLDDDNVGDLIKSDVVVYIVRPLFHIRWNTLKENLCVSIPSLSKLIMNEN